MMHCLSMLNCVHSLCSPIAALGLLLRIACHDGCRKPHAASRRGCCASRSGATLHNSKHFVRCCFVIENRTKLMRCTCARALVVFTTSFVLLISTLARNFVSSFPRRFPQRILFSRFPRRPTSRRFITNLEISTERHDDDDDDDLIFNKDLQEPPFSAWMHNIHNVNNKLLCVEKLQIEMMQKCVMASRRGCCASRSGATLHNSKHFVRCCFVIENRSKLIRCTCARRLSRRLLFSWFPCRL